ncbi:MAG: hypothetical protein IPH44_08140 [Myxococcales bacterium]|nr:hypothetical protein [Myxococcales bacterium]MBK7198519.1 hypothetical protein [Myxococcales bacterium]MBP6842999.1 hypothetical protein [Kofleriaceae bacterium]
MRPLPRRARYALAAAITAVVLSLVGRPPASRAAGAPPASHATAPAIGR